MRTRLLASGGLVIAVGVASFLGTYLGRVHFQSGNDTRPPVLEVDRLVDVGLVETEQTGTARFRVANRGEASLTLTSVRTDCGCLGVVLVREDGTRTAVAGTVLPPGREVAGELRFLVRGETGQTIHHNIWLGTSDPQNPEVRITCLATPTGRAAVVPNTVAFGTLLPGEVVQTLVEVRDGKLLGGCEVTHVGSTNPDCIAVRFLPATNDEPSDPNSAILGRIVGRVEVKLTAPLDGLLSEEVHIYLTGKREPTMKVPLTARVRPHFQLLPDEVRLPRASSSGPSYTTRVVCQNTRGTGVKVTLTKIPPDLSVRVEANEENVGMQRLVITVPNPPVSGSEPVTREIELTAADPQNASASEKLTLRIVIDPPK